MEEEDAKSQGYHNIPMTTLWREYTKRTQCNLERVVRPQPRQNLTHDASTLTSFMRPDAPDLMETAAFGHRKCSATKTTSSSLALPSTGGDFTFASQVPSGACIREEARALGFTLICMSTVAISAYGLTARSEEHTSELQSRLHLVCRLLLEKKNTQNI